MLPTLIDNTMITEMTQYTAAALNTGGGSVCKRGQASIGVLKQIVYFKKYENAKILEINFLIKKKASILTK